MRQVQSQARKPSQRSSGRGRRWGPELKGGSQSRRNRPPLQLQFRHLHHTYAGLVSRETNSRQEWSNELRFLAASLHNGNFKIKFLKCLCCYTLLCPCNKSDQNYSEFLKKIWTICATVWLEEGLIKACINQGTFKSSWEWVTESLRLYATVLFCKHLCWQWTTVCCVIRPPWS